MSQSGTYGSSGGGGGGDVSTLTGNTGGAVGPTGGGTINIIGSGGVAVTGNAGTNTLTITSTASTDVLTYTYVNTTPYVVLSTDQFLGVDTTASAITVKLPNAPATGRVFTIKDYAGNANVNAITITTVGGTVTIDGNTSYTLISTYSSVDVLFDGTNYLVY
jgi:hypothetical protein